MSRTARTTHLTGPESPRPRALADWVQALLTGLSIAVGGWLLVCLPVLISWLFDQRAESTVEVATRIWLLAHGSGVQLGAVRWTLIPLGITVLLGLALTLVISRLQRRLVNDDITGLRRLRLPAVTAGAYTAVVFAIALVLAPDQAGWALLGAVVLTLVSAGWAVWRVDRDRLLRTLPAWARVLPAAVGVGVWTVLAGGALAVALGVLRQRHTIAEIANGLGVDGLGAVQLVVAQLTFWPNLVIWAATWVLGSGFTLGADTQFASTATVAGPLPEIPVLGAVPLASGPWMMSWAAVGVAAGVMIAVVIVRRRPAARLDELTGVGLVAGVLTLAILTGLGVLSAGDIGAGRLTGLGPLLVDFLVVASTVLVIPPVLLGLVFGLVRHLRERRRAAAADTPEAPTAESGVDGDPTIEVGDRVGP